MLIKTTCLKLHADLIYMHAGILLFFILRHALLCWDGMLGMAECLITLCTNYDALEAGLKVIVSIKADRI